MLRGVMKMAIGIVVGVVALAIAGGGSLYGQTNAPAAHRSSMSTQSGTEDHPVPVSGGVMNGRILHKGTPVYPKIARDEHISGATVLSAVIDPTGKVVKLTVISGPEVLREPMLAAVRQWTYRPFMLNGHAVFVQTTIWINPAFGAG
jgi:protein TonB